MSHGAPPFAQQRIVCLALLTGIVLYAAVVAYLLNSGPVARPVPELDQVTLFAGIALAIGALVARGVLKAKANEAPAADRSQKHFVATLVPLAMLEGGCLLAITTWMVNTNTIPNLLIAGVLFAIAVVLVPFSDPAAA